MEVDRVRLLLRELRLLRAGSTSLAAVPPWVADMLAGNLAGTCRTLAAWADQRVENRRAADAFVRFYGLGQMPEKRASIARTLRTLTGRPGLAAYTVGELIDSVEQQLAVDIDELKIPGRWGIDTPGRWSDPYASTPNGGTTRRTFDAVLLLAWADIPADDAAHQAGRALLLYEQEHNLRDATVLVRHRQERQRMRHLAWSMLWVARQRHIAAEPDDVIIDRCLGPRYLAVVDRVPAGVAELLVNTSPVVDGRSGDRELVEVGLEYARDAVRRGDPAASEIIGLLRDTVARLPARCASAAVTAGVLGLHVIHAREHKLIGGVLAGLQAISLGLEVAAGLRSNEVIDPDTDPEAAAMMYSALRSAQEVAELSDTLGMMATACRALRLMRLLYPHAIPEDSDGRNSWQQQLLQTEASVSRHIAKTARRPERWLGVAQRAADQSYELATTHGHPPGYALVAANQRTATTLATLRLRADNASTASHQQLAAEAHQRTQVACRLAGQIDRDDRPHRSAVFGAHRRRWEFALLTGDYDEIIDARESTLRQIGSWTLPMHLEKVEPLERATREVAGAPTDPDRCVC